MFGNVELPQQHRRHGAAAGLDAPLAVEQQHAVARTRQVVRRGGAGGAAADDSDARPPDLFTLAEFLAVPEHDELRDCEAALELLERNPQIEKPVVFSTTNVLTKNASDDEAERELMARILREESQLRAQCRRSATALVLITAVVVGSLTTSYVRARAALVLRERADDRGVIEKFVREAGSDRMLFGTDLPWFDPHQAVGALLSADIDDEDRHNICHRNAEKLLAPLLGRQM